MTDISDLRALNSAKLYDLLQRIKTDNDAVVSVLSDLAPTTPVATPTDPTATGTTTDPGTTTGTGTVVVAPPASTMATVMLADGPQSYWDFQVDATTRTVADKGPAGATLQLQGTGWTTDTSAFRLAPYALGKIAQSNELVSGTTITGSWATATGKWNFAQGFSFEAWVSPANWNWMQTLCSFRVSGVEKLLFGHVNGQGFTLNGVALAGDPTLEPTTLHHLAVTVNAAGTSASLYWDGALVSTTAGSFSIPATADMMTLCKGVATNQPMLTTAWVHTAVYGSQLSAAQIKARWDAAHGSAPMPRRGRYNLQAIKPLTLLANRAKSMFFRDNTKSHSTTWWIGTSSVDEIKAEMAAGTEAALIVTRYEDAAMYQQAGLYAIPIVGSSRWNTDQMANAAMLASDRVAARFTEDEVSLDGTVANAISILGTDLDNADPNLPVIHNNGYDMLWRPPADAASIVNTKGPRTGRTHDILSMDYYNHSTGPAIRAEAGKKLGVIPDGATDAQITALQAKLRHSWAAFEVVRHLRTLLDHDAITYAFLAVGHANSIGGGMPTGREFRGDAWASFIGGAQGYHLFYHSFAEAPGWWSGGSFTRSSRLHYVFNAQDGRGDLYYRPLVEGTTVGLNPVQAPKEWEVVQYPYIDWSATYAHQQDDTCMLDGRYCTAVGKPTLGKRPDQDLYNDATDTGAWVIWQPQFSGLRNTVSFAPNMLAWVNKVKQEKDRFAPILHTSAGDLALADQKLIWRHWPNAERIVIDGDTQAYAWTAVMQGWDQWSGTYTVNIPAGVGQVEVFADLTSTPQVLNVVNGQAQVTFAKEYDVRFLRWVATATTPTTAPVTSTTTPTAPVVTTGPTVNPKAYTGALLGDSMVAPAGSDTVTPGTTPDQIKGWWTTSFGATPDTQVRGADGKRIILANNGGEDTLQWIDDVRAALGGKNPDVWVFALGLNTDGQDVEAERLLIQQVLAKVDEHGPCPVAWWQWATAYSVDGYLEYGYPDQGIAFNTMIADEMAKRGKYGHVVPVWDWLASQLMVKQPNGTYTQTGPANAWYGTDRTHALPIGCFHKYNDCVLPDVQKYVASLAS